jgi:type 1 glutamine amidotransferase
MVYRSSRRRWMTGAAAAAVAAAQQQRSESVRVLVVTGGHDHELSFYSLFDKAAGLNVNVDPHPAAFRRDIRKDYDVVALYDMVQVSDVDERRRGNLQSFVESGKGLVILHHALCSYNAWEWWWREVAGARYLLKAEGTTSASTYRHDETLKVMRRGDHPVLTGIRETQFVDETYGRMWHSPGNKVLLATDNATADGPLAWVSPYEKSRVVAIQPGHGREAHEHPMYRRLVRNAVLWSAGRPTAS